MLSRSMQDRSHDNQRRGASHLLRFQKTRTKTRARARVRRRTRTKTRRTRTRRLEMADPKDDAAIRHLPPPLARVSQVLGTRPRGPFPEPAQGRATAA
eukprot:758873-Hanusia_phi.AAC.1